MFTVLTSYSSTTYKAEIRGSLAKGFRKMYAGSCTSGEECAARRLVTKWYGAAAAATLRQVKDRREIEDRVGNYFASPQRKQVFNVWSFTIPARNRRDDPGH